ncbi:MAG TPA: T9SS type A sorting domain-containing protein [Flavobacterium sp.]|jgi:hypothetical protein
MKKRITLLTLSLLSFYYSDAQNLFKDDFSTYNTARLSGQGSWDHNSSTSGLGQCAGTSCTFANITANTVSYPNYGSSSKALSITPNSDGVGTFFPAVTTGDIYVALVLNLSIVQANNNSDFFRVASGGNYTTSFRLYVIPAGEGAFYIGTAKGGNTAATLFSTNAYNTNQDHLVVIKYSQLSGSNDDIVSVYVDPVFANGVPTTPAVTTSVGTDQSGSLDRLFFRLNSTNGMPTGRAGLVSVARTWADLAFSPLSTNNFEKSTFSIISNDIKNGSLSIKSNINLEKASLRIFDIQGKNVVTKNVSLLQDINEIFVNPISSSGIYIIEISGDNKKFVQKIVVD